MVAVRPLDQQTNEMEILPKQEKGEFDELLYTASKNGHELWRATAEGKGFSAAYPDDRNNMIRSGLVPFDVITELKRISKDVKNPQDIPNQVAVRVAEYLYKDESIKIEESFRAQLKQPVSPEMLEKVKLWIVELTQDWYKRNDNWANSAEQTIISMVDKYGDMSDPANRAKALRDLAELKSQFTEFKKQDTLNKMIDALLKVEAYKNKDFSMVNLLIKVHKGWRANKYNVDLDDSRLDYQFFEALRNPLLSVNARSAVSGIKDYITNTRLTDKGLADYLKTRIEEIREKMDNSTKSPAITFAYMFKLGKELEDMQSWMKKLNIAGGRAIDALQFKIDDIEDSIKLDANSGPIDTVIAYLENYAA